MEDSENQAEALKKQISELISESTDTNLLDLIYKLLIFEN